MKSYKTIYKESQVEIVEKKSRFISHAKPIANEEEAIEFINSIKSKYWDATHNVYAYSLYENGIQRYSDDGEPQGTAGIPTLQVIKNLELNDVVVVVTRYFGGIMLGAGGLVRAYGKSAKEGLVNAQIITKSICKKVEFVTDYQLSGKVQSKLINEGFIIQKIRYEEDIIFEILTYQEDVDKLKKILSEICCRDADIIENNEVTVLLNEDNLLDVIEN